MKKGGIVRDVLEELGETVKQTASSAAKVPGHVVKGALGQNKKDKVDVGEKGTDEKGMGTQADTSALDPKQKALQQAQLAQKKLQDKKLSQQKYKQIQEGLHRIQIERQRQREQGLDVYITGKPGEAETLEEKQDLIEKQRKEAEEAKKKEKKLPPSAKAGMGTAERVKPISG